VLSGGVECDRQVLVTRDCPVDAVATEPARRLGSGSHDELATGRLQPTPKDHDLGEDVSRQWFVAGCVEHNSCRNVPSTHLREIRRLDHIDVVLVDDRAPIWWRWRRIRYVATIPPRQPMKTSHGQIHQNTPHPTRAMAAPSGASAAGRHSVQ
jgi:hypothetical protein